MNVLFVCCDVCATFTASLPLSVVTQTVVSNRQTFATAYMYMYMTKHRSEIFYKSFFVTIMSNYTYHIIRTSCAFIILLHLWCQLEVATYPLAFTTKSAWVSSYDPCFLATCPSISIDSNNT